MSDGEGKYEVKDEREEIWEPPQQSGEVEVKSTAMVKSARKLPVYRLSRLDRYTDLHEPPDNWLRNDAQLSKTWVTGECTQFSSFAMAETLPDTVGEVDVISAAENIKKLLKIPFSKTQVSMAVHCVGKTLLLDELDLFKHLRSASEREKEWMKRFLIEAVLSEGKSLTMKRKTNELLQNWNLLSKFLYYSMGNRPEESEPPPTYDLEEPHLPPSQSALVQIPDLLPKTEASEFARQALWQFEDIRMLIGTDLPIFGEGTHPAVSLRLKDMSSPINVLTGLDYWLDNLMSNVPELAMCYHLNGIVQKYELLKTEEIPNLENAKFAPQVVNNIAQNILSFLKSHCTKEGHTYWLFRGQDEDVVKLYDLTSLCNEYPNRPWQNPFISPVAMLLYRVARNLSMNRPDNKEKATIHKLLKNCLQLLEGSEDRHPEVAASASHLLSHVFITEEDLTDPPPAPPKGHAHTPPKGHAHTPPKGHAHTPPKGHAHTPPKGHAHTPPKGHAHTPPKGHAHTPPKGHSCPPPAEPSRRPVCTSSSGEEEEEELIFEEEEALSVPTLGTQSLMLPSGGGSGGKRGAGFKDRPRPRRRRRSSSSATTFCSSKEEKAKVALLYVVKGLKSIMECTESSEATKEPAARLPSPQSSPTRAKPLCYPIQGSQNPESQEEEEEEEEEEGNHSPRELQDREMSVKTMDEEKDQSVSAEHARQSADNNVAPRVLSKGTLSNLKQCADDQAAGEPLDYLMPVSRGSCPSGMRPADVSSDSRGLGGPAEDGELLELLPDASNSSAELLSVAPAESVVDGSLVASSLPANPPASLPASLPTSQPASLTANLPASLQGNTPASLPGSLRASLPANQPASLPASLPSNQAASLPVRLPASLPARLPSNLPVNHSASLPATLPANSPVSLPTMLPATLPASLSGNPQASFPPVVAGGWHQGSWQHKLSILLLRKAWETYLVLAKAARDSERYSRALHLARMSLLCRSACLSLQPEEANDQDLLSDQLTVCGDCLILMTHDLATYTKQPKKSKLTTDEDRWILKAIKQHDCTNAEYEWAVDFRDDTEHNLQTGILCYTLALSNAGGHMDDYVIALTRKQGNARNELGVLYMNRALALRNQKAGLAKEQEVWRKSLSCFESGIDLFEKVKDAANVALLLCNLGKLMRLCAFSCGEVEPGPGSEMSQQERYYYNKATDYYQKALSRLGQSKRNPALWESVTWELSSTHFAVATILQDHPPLSSMAQEQVEKDIIEAMTKALSLCEVEDTTPAKQPVYQYRAATIHHRLASLYHNTYRNMSSQQKQKHSRSLSELHYQKAVRLFQELDRPTELLRVLLERVALLEHQFDGQSGVSARIKTLHSALEILLQCKPALSSVHRAKAPTAGAAAAADAATASSGASVRTLSANRHDGKGDAGGDTRKAAPGRELQERSQQVRSQGSSGETASDSDCKEPGDAGGTESGPGGIEGMGAEEAQIPRISRQLGDGDLSASPLVSAPCRSSTAPSKPTQRSSPTPAEVPPSEGGQTSQGHGSKAREGVSKEEEEEEERLRLESMWESRLQYMLLNLVKLHSTNRKGGQHLAVYKKMYAVSLGRTLPASSTGLASPLATKTLAGICEDILQLYQSIK